MRIDSFLDILMTDATAGAGEVTPSNSSQSAASDRIANIEEALNQEHSARRSRRRNRRRGFKPTRRGRPRGTISGGSR